MRNYVKLFLVTTETGDETDPETGRIIRFGETTYQVDADGPESSNLFSGNPSVFITVQKVYLGPMNKRTFIQILNDVAGISVFSFREFFLSSEFGSVQLRDKSPRGKN